MDASHFRNAHFHGDEGRNGLTLAQQLGESNGIAHDHHDSHGLAHGTAGGQSHADEDASERTAIAVCRHSGYRAGRYCADTEERMVPQAGNDSQLCPYCHPVHLSLDGQCQITDRSEPAMTRNMFSLPPIMEYYYRQEHPEYIPLPKVKVSLNQIGQKANPMRFLYPREGSVIKIPRQLDGTRGQLTCSIAHSDASAEVFWHCGSSYVGSTKDIHSMTLDLDPGTHTISAVDSNGSTVSVTFSVVQ